MKAWVIFLSLISLYHTSISTKQPWPIKVDRVGLCCSGLSFNLTSFSKLEGNSQTLAPCFNNLEANPYIKPSSASVLLLTIAENAAGDHAISNIDLYAPYQQAVLRSYAEHHNFGFIARNEVEIGSNDNEMADPRWNKIQLLIDLANSHVVESSQLLFWIDSDAIILDFNFSPPQLAAMFPKADIIASSDIKMGLINSGVMIIRNTVWSREFLVRWWTIADRNVVCDQDAFDLLYRQLITENHNNADKIQILPMDAMNSHPPAWKYQKSDNQILHLMGESSIYRGLVFQEAFRSICHARSGGILAPQLGVSQSVLLDLAQVVYHNETQRTFITANTTGTLEDIEELSKASHHYVDILHYLAYRVDDKSKPVAFTANKRDYLREIGNIRQAVMNLVLYHLEENKHTLNDIVDQLNSTATVEANKVEFLSQQRRRHLHMIVSLLKKAAEAGNSLFWTAHRLEDRKEVALLVFDLLQELMKRVVDESKATPRHMTALMYQNLAVSIYEQAIKQSFEPSKNWAKKMMFQEAQGFLQQSVAIFDEFFATSDDSSVNTEHLQSLQLLAGITCLQQEYLQGTELWRRALSKAEANLHGVKLGLHYEKLAIIQYNAAVCFMESRDLVRAKQLTNEAMIVLQDIIKQQQGQPGQQSPSSKVERMKGHDEITDLPSFFKVVEQLHQQTCDQLESNQVRESHRIQRQQQLQQTPPSPLHLETATVAATATVAKIMNAITQPDGTIKYVLDQQTKAIEEEEEWEECPDFETEGCEDFDVAEVTLPPPIIKQTPQQASHVNAASSGYQVTGEVADESSYLYEGMDQEEREEMIYTRQRHAINTKDAREALNRRLLLQERANQESQLRVKQDRPTSACSIDELQQLRRKTKRYKIELLKLVEVNEELQSKLNYIANILGEAPATKPIAVIKVEDLCIGESCEDIYNCYTRLKDKCDLLREQNWILDEQLEEFAVLIRRRKQ